MKRVKAACICQTLHFTQKEITDYNSVVKLVDYEVEQYKKKLDRNATQYRILEQTRQPDGSVIIKIIKQYNTSPVGSYLDQD